MERATKSAPRNRQLRKERETGLARDLQLEILERATGLEPATLCLGSKCATIAPRPLKSKDEGEKNLLIYPLVNLSNDSTISIRPFRAVAKIINLAAGCQIKQKLLVSRETLSSLFRLTLV